MPTRVGKVSAARDAAGHASAIARLELRLAIAELKQELPRLGLAAGLAIGGALLGLFALAFVLATITAGIATAIPVWAALLVMTGVVLAATLGLLLLALRAFRRGMPPTPERAIAEAKLTADALTSNGRHA
jgi:hypothetical protein